MTFIEVISNDVFGTEERAFGDYLNKFTIISEKHSKNISVDERKYYFRSLIRKCFFLCAENLKLVVKNLYKFEQIWIFTVDVIKYKK